MAVYFLDFEESNKDDSGIKPYVIYGPKREIVAQDLSPSLAAGEFGVHLLRISYPVSVEVSDLQKTMHPSYVMAVKKMVELHNAHVTAPKKSLFEQLFNFHS